MWSFPDKCASLASSIPREKLTNEFPWCNVCVTLKFNCSHVSSYHHKTSAEETYEVRQEKDVCPASYFGIFQKKHEKALVQCIHGHRIISVLCKEYLGSFQKRLTVLILFCFALLFSSNDEDLFLSRRMLPLSLCQSIYPRFALTCCEN